MRIVDELRSARDFVVQNTPVVGQQLERHYWRRFASERANYLTYFGVYPDFASAAKDMPATLTAGFNHARGASLYLEQTHQILARDYPVVYWLGRLLSDSQNRVFDLGGNIGTKYYAFQHYLAFPASLHWTVCELPVIPRCGAEWATQHDTRGQLGSAPIQNRPTAATCCWLPARCNTLIIGCAICWPACTRHRVTCWSM